MRYDVGRFRRPMRRSTEGQLMSLISLGDGSTLTLDFTTGVLDPRLTFTRASTGTFINSSGNVATASNNVARFDHDPTTLAPRGLLIEGTATNYLPFSQGLVGTGWFTGGICTKTQNYATGPDGVANSATRLEMSYSGGEGRTYYASSYTTLPHTNSVWLKSNTGSNQTVRLWNTSGTPVTCTVTPTWQRFQSVNTTGTSLPGYFYLENPSSTVAVDILAWGAQLEAGSGASSYIPTGASTVQRLADNCYIYDTTTTGGLSWFKTATQGTFYVEMSKRTAGTAFAAAAFGTRATAFQDFMLYQAVGNNWLSFNWGAGEYTTNYSALSSPFLIKAAVALSPSTPATEADSTVSINGSNSALNTGPNIALPFTRDLSCTASRGSASGIASSQNYAETAIRRIKFFPFAMTAAQMNAMTTL